MEKLVIAHMYPDLLNLYGDRGNVLAMYHRAFLRGIEVEIKQISVGDELNPDEIDIVFLGGGQDSEQNIMNDDFVNNKGPLIKSMIDNGKVFLAICGGYQLLGKYYKEHDGKILNCLGAIDYYTEGHKERFINDTVYELTLSNGNVATIVGFENHSGRTYLGEGISPLMKVKLGHGNNGEDGFEGVHYKNAFCTYSHGSVLPKNPELTDMLIEAAMKNRYDDSYVLKDLDMSSELEAKKAALDYIENGKEQMI